MKTLDFLLEQLTRCRDVFGTDIYIHYEACYVWQANQFGHMFIGLGSTLVAAWFSGEPALALGLVCALYLLKEMLDFLISWRLTGKVFAVRLGQVAVDCAVDLGFVTAGGLVAYTSLCESLLWGTRFFLWSVVLLFLFYFLVSPPYVRAKRAFDRSGLPYFSRLATFPPGCLVGSDLPQRVAQIEAFALGCPGPHQLIITGPQGSGRTSLASAIGGEATSECQRVRYLNAARLLGKAGLPCEPKAAEGQPWSLTEADLIIIDELAPLLGDLHGNSQVDRFLDRIINSDNNLFLRPSCEGRGREGGMASVRIVWVVDDPCLAAELEGSLLSRFPQLSIVQVSLLQPQKGKVIGHG